VKKSARAPWEVDKAFGPEYLRAECMKEAVFTTDHAGRKLDPPVKMLLVGATRIRPPLNAGVWARDDATGQWTRAVLTDDIVRADGERNTGLRAIAGHYDAVTGVHYVFAAPSAGAIFRGAYDPAAPGNILWKKQPELGGARKRIHGFSEANGALYAAVGVDPAVTGPEGGGLFRRVDGPRPRWEFEYRWKAESDHRKKSMPAFRGLTAIPAADGQGEELIGAPETLGVIEVISPRKGHAARQELDIGAYFARAWKVTGEQGGGLFAYNATWGPRLADLGSLRTWGQA